MKRWATVAAGEGERGMEEEIREQIGKALQAVVRDLDFTFVENCEITKEFQIRELHILI